MEAVEKVSHALDILRTDPGIFGVMDSVEQFSWIVLLKMLDSKYNFHFKSEFRWSKWSTRIVDELQNEEQGGGVSFIEDDLFPYLRSLANSNRARCGFDEQIGNCFIGLRSKILSENILIKVLHIVESFTFDEREDVEDFAAAYEDLLRDLFTSGGHAGEFQSPPFLVRTIVNAIDPKFNETIYDPAAGSCGFLVEAFKYIYRNSFTNEQSEFQGFFCGNEITSYAYLLGFVNLLVHGALNSQLLLKDSLKHNLYNINEGTKYDVIISSPPFGKHSFDNRNFEFPIKSTDYEVNFLQLIMMSLNESGRAAVVVPERFITSSVRAYSEIRLKLLHRFNLYAVLKLPSGAFSPSSAVKCVVLFFDTNGSTNKTWFYDCSPSRKINKKNPLTDEDLDDFLELIKVKGKSDNSWSVHVNELEESFEAAAVNPFQKKLKIKDTPQNSLDKLVSINENISTCLVELKSYISLIQKGRSEWEHVRLKDLGTFVGGRTPNRKNDTFWGGDIPWITPKDMKQPELHGSSLNISKLGFFDSKIHLIPKDSVLIVVRSGILRHSLPVCINRVETTINQDLKAFLPNSSVLPEYIRYVLLGNEERLLRDAVKSGVTVQSVRFPQFSQFLVPVPSLEEQSVICKNLDNCFANLSSLKEKYEEALGCVDMLKSLTPNYATNYK